METGNVRLVSKATDGDIGNDNTGSSAAMSCDGAFVVFSSSASNLTSNDTNNATDVFLADVRNGIKLTNLTQQALWSTGTPNITDMACNGRYITFSAGGVWSIVPETQPPFNSEQYAHVYMYDRLAATMTMVDKNYDNQIEPKNSTSGGVSDAGQVVFSTANRYVLQNGGYDAYQRPQVYIKDMRTGAVQRLSVNSTGIDANNSSFASDMTSDGSKAMLQTLSTNFSGVADTNNLSDIYVSETGY